MGLRHVLSLQIVFIFFISCGFSPPPEENRKNLIKEEPCLNSSNSSSLKAIFDCDGNKLPDKDANSKEVNWIKLSSKNEKHKKFNGVGRYGGCTGSLIDTQTGESSSPAYILTNGHCISYNRGLLPADGAFFDLGQTRAMTFDYYYDFEPIRDRKSYKTKNVLYATMDSTDIALVELEGVTLQELKILGINAYEISASIPEENKEIINVGIPATGLDEVVLRYSLCKRKERVPILEGGYKFPNAYQLKCNVLSGSSGSPVFIPEENDDSSIRKIAWLVNTTVNDSSEGQNPCSLNRPCEVDDNGIKTVNTKINYMQGVSFLSSCFDDKGIFDKNLSSCKLVGVSDEV